MSHSRLYIIILIIASLGVHFVFFGHPNETVFDEVHFGKFISGYFTGEYFFDIHPPLAKLLISGMGWLGGFQPGFSFGQIGDKFPDGSYLWLRFLPTLAGALLPIIIYFLARRLKFSKLAAFSTGILVILDNALLTQSRFILLDSFLLLFGFSSLLAYFKFAQEGKSRWLFTAGLLAVLAVLVKLTGIAFLGVIAVLEFWRLAKKIRFKSNDLIKPILAVLAVPAVVYAGLFFVHLKLLSKSGPGDAFMSPGFQKTLAGNKFENDPSIRPLGMPAKIIELNSQMYQANSNLTAGHPYSSKWYSWPVMARPIYFWLSDQQGGASEKIYLIGNPAIWWLSALAMFYLVVDLAVRVVRRLWHQSEEHNFIEVFLVGFFLVNLLPFVYVTRALFLYHYFPALIVAILTLVYLIDKIPKKKTVFTVLLSASIVLFLFFAPINYGLKLSDRAFEKRVWFSSWQ